MTNKKITGKFSLDDFVNASEKYLALNVKKVKDYSKMNKLSYEEAKKHILAELVFDYNGNVKLKSK